MNLKYSNLLLLAFLVSQGLACQSGQYSQFQTGECLNCSQIMYSLGGENGKCLCDQGYHFNHQQGQCHDVLGGSITIVDAHPNAESNDLEMYSSVPNQAVQHPIKINEEQIVTEEQDIIQQTSSIKDQLINQSHDNTQQLVDQQQVISKPPVTEQAPSETPWTEQPSKAQEVNESQEVAVTPISGVQRSPIAEQKPLIPTQGQITVQASDVEGHDKVKKDHQCISQDEQSGNTHRPLIIQSPVQTQRPSSIQKDKVVEKSDQSKDKYKKPQIMLLTNIQGRPEPKLTSIRDIRIELKQQTNLRKAIQPSS